MNEIKTHHLNHPMSVVTKKIIILYHMFCCYCGHICFDSLFLTTDWWESFVSKRENNNNNTNNNKTQCRGTHCICTAIQMKYIDNLNAMKRDRTKTKQNSKSGCCNIVKWMFVCESYAWHVCVPFQMELYWWRCVYITEIY